ncbi:GH3 auxin-responsive promoter family protein, partial [Candidatus Sumerlaeota bacterium]|nr:GH3 auxin-responsive promoter family protein [Candidatus Sumerlaeota bacterium]
RSAPIRDRRARSRTRCGAPARSPPGARWPADAAAARQIIRLKQLFPAVELQPKGLLATEAFVSFPMANRPGAALAVRSHFFEFEECDPCATSESHTLQLRLAHELEPSRRYRVLATTGGGLYRYQLRDEVEIVGYEGECPLLKFIGKSDQVSDLVGEKLSEPCVREALDSVLEENGLSPSFALVAPIEEDVPGYCLFIQDGQLSAGISRRIAHDLQKLLEANPHYRYAVGLNQLGPLRIHELDPGGESAWTIYERKQIARGQKAGDIKPLALDRNSDWKAEFESLLDHSHLERRIIR